MTFPSIHGGLNEYVDDDDDGGGGSENDGGDDDDDYDAKERPAGESRFGDIYAKIDV